MKRPLETCYKELPSNANVLDIGCLGFYQRSLGEKIRPRELNYFGVDYCETADLPPNFVFKKADLNQDPLPFDDDLFDFVIATHIIEHLRDPISFFGECLRVCKPGGLLYLEAPSERSLLLPQMPFQHDRFFSLSFFDDPTHLSRPWSPQSLYRLTKLYSCEPIKCDYLYSIKHRICFPLLLLYSLITRNGGMLQNTVWQTVGWAAGLLARKPVNISGKPKFNYYIPER